MRSLVAAGLWAALSVATQTADAQEPIARLPLDEAVTLTLLENPVVRAKEFERQAVAANEITAGLRPNPQVTFLSEQHPAGSASVPQYTFSIGQPIELGGKRQRRVDSARAAPQVAGYELADLKRQAVYQVKKSFADILVARDSLALAEENLTTLDELDRNQGEIARTRADVSRAAAARQAVAIQALAEVDTVLSALRSEAGKARALRDTYLPKARQARDTVDYAYRRGGVSLLDFLDTQRTYRETSLEYLRTLGRYRAAVHQLEAAVGGPLEN